MLKQPTKEPLKEGIEKIDLPPRIEQTVNPDGTVTEKKIPQWEIKARGVKYVKELKGIFKDSAPQMIHEGMKEWNDNGGDLRITRADGSSDIIRADKEQMLRATYPGLCQHRLRPGITMPHMPWHKPCGHSKVQACHCGGDD